MFANQLACLPWTRRGPDRGDFPLFHDDFEFVANSIGQNQTRMREDHLVMQAILPAPSCGLNRNSRHDRGKSSRLSASLDALALERHKGHPLRAMNFDYDVVIIGGAFSGAATALMLKRKRPEARVLIIEKGAAFDRKVGESTTEVSSCYMTRILGLTHYLGHHQLPKQGLRLWFSNRNDQRFDDCVEIGTRYQSRLPGFQVDRAKLDSHLLELACKLGCDIWRPAKVTAFELNDGNGQTIRAIITNGAKSSSTYSPGSQELAPQRPRERMATCRWIIDATGRAAMFARKLGHFRPNTEHPINAAWARFSGVKEWDSYEWRERFPEYANHCRTAREWATNHLFG